jgi:GTPase SAR1 family protein
MIVITQQELQEKWSMMIDQETWPENWSKEKGFILIGNPGVGKTYFMEAFHKNRKENFRQGWKLDPSSSKEGIINNKGIIPGMWLDHDLYFDDFGLDGDRLLVYGTEVKPGSELIFNRYAKWKKEKEYSKKPQLTFLTTNFTPETLEQVVGVRVWDRITEMCNVVLITGESLRK